MLRFGCIPHICRRLFLTAGALGHGEYSHTLYLARRFTEEQTWFNTFVNFGGIGSFVRLKTPVGQKGFNRKLLGGGLTRGSAKTSSRVNVDRRTRHGPSPHGPCPDPTLTDAERFEIFRSSPETRKPFTPCTKYHVRAVMPLTPQVIVF